MSYWFLIKKINAHPTADTWFIDWELMQDVILHYIVSLNTNENGTYIVSLLSERVWYNDGSFTPHNQFKRGLLHNRRMDGK